ncbi:MAG: SurA N-terminal domain-containing protein [Clostridia bacterium]|nr:SurA N-terminal domain-containing protein [Clostridia bacterium]
MKKYIIGIIVVIVLLVAVTVVIAVTNKSDILLDDKSAQSLFEAGKKSFESTEVVAIVNGEKIYKGKIDYLVTAKEISQKNEEQSSDVSSFSSEDFAEQVLNEQIRNIVVRQEAERIGLKVSYEESYNEAKNNYDIVKEAGGTNYEIIISFMNEMGYSEKEYLEKSAEVYAEMLLRGKLYTHFTQDKTGNYEELVELYNIYVDELIKKADIKYK